MALHGLVDAQLGAVVPENPVIFGVTPSAEGVGEHVEVGGDPLGLPLEVAADLGGGEMPGHFEPDLVAGAAVLEEVEAGRGVGFSGDPVVGPGGAPEVAGHDMSEELEIGDVEVLEIWGGWAGDKFSGREIENADARETTSPAVRAGVHGDVGGGGEFQEGDAIAEIDGIDPPADVFEEGVIQDDGEAGAGGTSFGGEDAIEEKAARGNDTSRIDEAAGEGGQFLLGSGLLGQPYVESFQEGRDFFSGEGDGVLIEVVFQSKSRAAR